jgi:hypothetical protein
VTTFHNIFRDWIINLPLWPSWYLIWCCLTYLWGSLKDNIYKYYSHTEDRLKEIIRLAVSPFLTVHEQNTQYKILQKSNKLSRLYLRKERYPPRNIYVVQMCLAQASAIRHCVVIPLILLLFWVTPWSFLFISKFLV